MDQRLLRAVLAVVTTAALLVPRPGHARRAPVEDVAPTDPSGEPTPIEPPPGSAAPTSPEREEIPADPGAEAAPEAGPPEAGPPKADRDARGADAEGPDPGEPPPTTDPTAPPADEPVVAAPPPSDATVPSEPTPPAPILGEDTANDEFADDEFADDDYDELRDSPAAVQARRRIIGGGILTGVGLVLAGGAVGMALSDPCKRPAGNSCSVDARSRAARTMGVPAGLILAGGVALLAIGLHARSRIKAGLTFDRSGGGGYLMGRF